MINFDFVWIYKCVCMCVCTYVCNRYATRWWKMKHDHNRCCHCAPCIPKRMNFEFCISFYHRSNGFIYFGGQFKHTQIHTRLTFDNYADQRYHVPIGHRIQYSWFSTLMNDNVFYVCTLWIMYYIAFSFGEFVCFWFNLRRCISHTLFQTSFWYWASYQVCRQVEHIFI